MPTRGVGHSMRRRTASKAAPGSDTLPRKASSASRASPSVPLTHSWSPARAPERSSAWPMGTAPNTVMQMLSGPAVVSPPTSSMPCASASANRPPRKAFEKGLVDARHRQRQREGQRLGAAGRQIRQVHRQRLVAKPLRRDRRQEMPPFDQHVARDGQLLPGGQRREQRAIVADAERRAPRGPREVARDQVEFAEGHRCVTARV